MGLVVEVVATTTPAAPPRLAVPDTEADAVADRGDDAWTCGGDARFVLDACCCDLRDAADVVVVVVAVGLVVGDGACMDSAL